MAGLHPFHGDPLIPPHWLGELAGLRGHRPTSLQLLWQSPPPMESLLPNPAGVVSIRWNRRGEHQLSAPREAARMGGRLMPLLQVGRMGALVLAPARAEGELNIQFHDEAPAGPCLRIDAPFEASRPGQAVIPDPYCLGSHGFLRLRQQLVAQPPPPWRDRRPVALWRGATTDRKELGPATIHTSKRYQLCRIGLQHPHWLDARFTDVVQCASAVDRQQLMGLLQGQGLLAPRLEPIAMAQCRWLMDLDGNVNSWGLLWKLLSGSCVIRVTSHRGQWFHQRLRAYAHLVPVRADLADLAEQLAWCQANPDHCAAIAHNGQQLALQVLEDLGADLLTAIAAEARW